MDSDYEPYVIKRNGKKQPVFYDKIRHRIKKLSYGLDPKFCNPTEIAQKVISNLSPGISTSQIDTLSAETAAYLCGSHYHYETLASRIAISNLQKNTQKSFAATIQAIAEYLPTQFNEEFLRLVREHGEKLDARLMHDRDYSFSFFGYKTLEKSYLLAMRGQPVERPQHLYMRVALQIHGDDLPAVFETYDLLSRKVFTHATPTLFNCGLRYPQLASCFLMDISADSIEGIYKTLGDCAKISKFAGGIGIAISKIRGTKSIITSTNGTSNGIVPMLRVFNATARYVDQGGGKRKGSFAIYLEPWHIDVFEFVELKKNTGKEENRARDLNIALWVPDLFMKRVEAGGKWTLFCPYYAPGLDEVYGDDFDELYLKYEADETIPLRREIDAQELWYNICTSLIETGEPYILFKDSCNRKSNHKHLGTIKSSNLCCEIIEFTSPSEIAVCNLASVNLREFVRDNGYDFEGLRSVVSVMVRNLNKVIDKTYYPLPETSVSNLRHRPIGVGVQGLADVFALKLWPFDCEEARELNRDIFENIYYAACETSIELAREHGRTYETYPGSPMSQGIFQHDMWGSVPTKLDWDSLREKLLKYGIYNSLLIAPMPTASTSQILGTNECFEPFTSNYYSRRVLAGDFPVINQYLIEYLVKENIWSSEIKNHILLNRGSIAQVPGIPDHIKAVFRTVWEIKQRSLIEMAADRAPFIDQSQSFNLFLEDPSYSKVSSMLFYSWRKGLKTGVYYLRTRPKANPIQFTVERPNLYELPVSGQSILSPVSPAVREPDTPLGVSPAAPEIQLGVSHGEATSEAGPVCTRDEGCVSCGS